MRKSRYCLRGSFIENAICGHNGADQCLRGLGPVGTSSALGRPVPLQEIAAAAEAMAAEAGGTWGDVLTYIVDAARAEGEKREPVADSRQIQDLQEKLLAAQAKIIQLQDELLTKQKEGHAGAPKAAPARIGDSAARL